MKKAFYIIASILICAGIVSAQIPTIIPVGPVYQTLVLLKGARISANQYLNFGPTYGTAGYGFKDNAGTIQYKNSGGSWANIGSGGGGTTLIGLTDFPAAYAGAGGYLLRVNAGADAVEFVAGSSSLVGLGSVENTALSTWAGSANITTLGTIGTGTWNATAIGNTKGGTGQDSNAWTGYPFVTSGTWAADTQLAWSGGVLTAQTTSGTNTNTNFTLKGKGTGDGLITLYGGGATYYSTIQCADTEGLAGADLRWGLDPSNRTLLIGDRDDLGSDLGLSAEANPTINLRDAVGTASVKFTYAGETYSGPFTISGDAAGGYANTIVSNNGDLVFATYGAGSINLVPRTSLAVGNGINFAGTYYGETPALTATNTEQNWTYFKAIINQSSTAAANIIGSDVTWTTVGSGATGNGNNWMNYRAGGVSLNRIDMYGHTHGGETASLADTAVLTTNIADTWVGQIIITTSDGYCAIYRIDGVALTAVSANAIFTNTKGTDAKWNVYIETNVVKVENQMGTTQTAKALFLGY